MNDQSGWQLEGDAPDAFERYMGPAFVETWTREIVKRANLVNEERLLDVACGTGMVARGSAGTLGPSGDITGIDLNAAMLKKARKIGEETGLSIAWEESDVTSMPFTDHRFDVAICQQSLQYFPEKDRALSEVYRVLAPGGRFLLSVWRSMSYFPFYVAFHEALERYVGAAPASMLASAFTMGDAEELRGLVEDAGFTDVRVSIVIKQMKSPSVGELVRRGALASPFAGEIMAMDPLERDGMIRAMEASLLDYVDDDGLAAPMESYIVTASKQPIESVP